MPQVRINLTLTAAMAASLDKLAAKIGLDRTNTIRYCIACTLEAHAVALNAPAKSESRK